MKKYLLPIVVGATLSTFSAHADTLLIVSSGGGMFGGSRELNTAVENAGASLVEKKIGGKYRKVYKVIGRKPDREKLSLLKTILSERESNERLDVISMQHGPDGSFLDGVYPSDIERVLPKNYVGRVYTTSCNEYADFVSTDFGELRSIRKRSTFSKHMKRLGVNEFVIHANMNATGGTSLPFILDEISKGQPLVDAVKKAFDRVDAVNVNIIPELANIGVYMDKNVGGEIEYNYDQWTQTLYSRPVLASADKEHVKEVAKGRSMLSSRATSLNLQEELLGPTKEYSNILSRYLDGGISESMRVVTLEKASNPLHKSADIILGELSKAVSAIGPNNDGCIANETAQYIVDAVFKTDDAESPRVQSFCFKKANILGKKIYTLKWKLSGENRKVKFNTDIIQIPQLKQISLSRTGKIQFLIRPLVKDLKVRFTGIRIDLNGFDGNGKLSGLTKIRPINAKIKNDGRVSFVVGPALRIGLASMGADKIINGFDFLKVLGIKVLNL